MLVVAVVSHSLTLNIVCSTYAKRLYIYDKMADVFFMYVAYTKKYIFITAQY